jgi:ribosomal protein S18 acetylase RimI-like enzyme
MRLTMELSIRQYHPSDLPALFQVCLLTGSNGVDATALYRDPELLGRYFVEPYVTFEPELCSVLAIHGLPCGYILGTHDSATFATRCERDFFPVLRDRYSPPPDTDASMDAWVIRLIHTGFPANSIQEQYPAHLHIDILPKAQGQGWGRALMTRFIAQLHDRAVPGLHLRVGKANTEAIDFYKRLGFKLLNETERTVLYGQRL